MMRFLIYSIPPIVVGAFLYFTLISAFEFNPVSIQKTKAKLIFTLAPQGWGFFSRDPREEQILVYKKTETGYALVNKSGAEPQYLFGLSRTSRKINIELGNLFSQIPDSLWIEPKVNELEACEEGPLHRFKNPFQNPLCTGAYLVVKSKPVPWAWSESSDRITMPIKYCRVDVD